MKYRSQDSGATFEEISNFVYSNPQFPDINILIDNAQNSIKSSTPNKLLKSWFNKYKPSTAEGYVNFLRVADLKDKNYSTNVKNAWIKGRFSDSEAKEFYKKYSKYLSKLDHYHRVDHLLWIGTKSIAHSLKGMIEEDKLKLVKARIALLNHNNNMTKIVESVPQTMLTDPGLLFAKALWYKKRKDIRMLAKMLSDNSQENSTKSDRWAKIRMVLASELIDEGEYKLAYQIITDNEFKDIINYVDAELMAGKIGYLYLGDYKKALAHFENLLNKSEFSISRSKGAYWAARAASKLGDKSKADKYYKIAAEYPDTFYGQLAILKTSKDKVIHLPKPPAINEKDIEWVNQNEFVQISKLLANNKRHNLARKFITKAVIQADTKSKKILLVKIGHSLNIISLSVVCGKEMARRGYFEKNYSYPLKNFNLPFKVEEALINSIIRQESEFDQYALSSAKAMGLMQLILPTAKDVSKKLKTKFSPSDLFHNSELNAKFGTYHLSELIERYVGSYVLAIAAYNAGSKNVDKWISNYGDPRKTDDYNAVVGWIEKIPFYETRAYVQHVLSNLQIYRNNLKDKESNKLEITIDKDLVRKNGNLD
jgi:soluble lytic murein transglycosylase